MVRGTKGKHRSALLAAALSRALDIPCWLPTFSGTRTWTECKRHWFVPNFTDELWQEVGLSDLVSTAERLMKGPLPPSYPPAQEADQNGDEEVEMVTVKEDEPDQVKEEEEAAPEVPEEKDGPSPAPSPADMPEAAAGSDKIEEGTPTEPPPPAPDQSEDGPWIEIARPSRPVRPKPQPQPTTRRPDSPPSEFVRRSSDQET